MKINEIQKLEKEYDRKFELRASKLGVNKLKTDIFYWLINKLEK